MFISICAKSITRDINKEQCLSTQDSAAIVMSSQAQYTEVCRWLTTITTELLDSDVKSVEIKFQVTWKCLNYFEL